MIDGYQNIKIIGLSISNKHDTECVFEAIKSMSISINNSKLFHSECGGEFANNKLKEKLEALNVRISMSLTGCPYDNAISEYMFKFTKK